MVAINDIEAVTALISDYFSLNYDVGFTAKPVEQLLSNTLL